MPLRDNRFPASAWLRKCQECGHVQVARDPQAYSNDAWRDIKCKRCKSEALDYGTTNEYTVYEEDNQ